MELLGPSKLGADSNFFACGGQSLQAIQCLSRLRDRTAVLLSLSDFFENATVAQLAVLVEQRLASAPARTDASNVAPQDAVNAIPQREHSQPCRLSPTQEGIWFMEQFNTGEPMYNEAEAVRLKGVLDVGLLQQAFNAVVARHEILRTTITLKDNLPEAAVHAQWPVKFKIISLRGLVPEERESALAELLTEEPRQPYRLEAEPGIRVTVVEVDENDHAVILMMHHIVCDSSSIGILWRELATFYATGRDGLPICSLQYGDYAAWRRQKQFAEDLTFWKEALSGAPALLDLPLDRPRPAVFSFRGNRRIFEFGAGLTDDLRELCRRQQTTMFAVFAAALNTLMYRYTMQEDILIGIPIADRELPDLRSMIGSCWIRRFCEPGWTETVHFRSY